MRSHIDLLPWDSEFFGLKIGRVTPEVVAAKLDDLARAADANGFDCVYLQLASEDASGLAAAQGAGWRVVDVRVDLEATTPPAAIDETATRDAVPADHDWITKLAGRRFTRSRFAADDRFPTDAAARMFVRWAERGLAGPPDQLLVSTDRRGFVLCGRGEDTASIELICTSADAPRGSGGRLMSAAHERFGAWGCTRATVATQASNVEALRLYERAGYRVKSTAYWLHRWRG